MSAGNVRTVGPLRPRFDLPGQRQVLAPVGAALILIVFTLCLRYRPGGARGVLVLDDLTQLTAAVAAAVSAVWAARRSLGRMRRSWSAAAIGAGCWAGGQLVWCYYELVVGRPAPFPSAADAGYLVFPVAAAASLWLFPSVEGAAGRRRWIFDGGIVVTALVAVSWMTTLGAIARAGGDSHFALGVSLAYPIGDILILTMALSGLGRASLYRTQLVLLSGAMSAMAVADSSFAYLTAAGKYVTGGPSDIGWVASFLLLAVAAVHCGSGASHDLRSLPPSASGAGRKGEPERAPDVRPAGRPEAASMLPYIPLLIASVVMVARHFTGHPVDGVEALALAAAFGLVLVRQYNTVRENRRLLDAIAAREAALHQQAFYDQLTGLPNRSLFTDRVQHALDLHRRDLRSIAVLFCDLDDFKTVNDTMGHGAGDTLLVRVAERLRVALRPGDTLARLGGDEFAVLLEDGGEPAAVAARLVQALREGFDLGGVIVTVRASIGVTVLRPEQETPVLDGLLAQADIAMYSAKRAGKGQLAVYHPAMVVPHTDDLLLRQPLATAIATRAIAVAFQPIIDLSDGSVHGFEALARWTHEQQPVPPGQFIPVASRAGLLDELTEHMLHQACGQLAVWTERYGRPDLRVGVNVPPGLVADRAFPGLVARVIDRYRLRPGQLVLEITEDALLDDLEDARVVTGQLRELGARLSLDDFGRGYSSLLHLQQITLDSLKIDKGFLAEVDRDPAAERFTAAILSLGSNLGLSVIAEGVERTTQAEVLVRLGCPMAQGYLFGRPATPEDNAGVLLHGVAASVGTR